MTRISNSISTVSRRRDFGGEKQDLEEILGNLLDNACKWAGSRVQLHAHPGGDDQALRLILVIADDGPGVARSAGARGHACNAGAGSTRRNPVPVSVCRSWMISLPCIGAGFALESAAIGGLQIVLDLPGDFA